eukprot:264901_1
MQFERKTSGDDPQTPLKDKEADDELTIELSKVEPTFHHEATIRDIILLPPHSISPEDIDFEIAITYLGDALKIRPPQRRIRELLGSKFKPLLAYNIMKSWLWSRIIYFLIWFNMLLTIWEPPQETNDNSYWNIHRVSIIIIFQMIFILFYSFDIYLKFYSHDKREIGQWTYIISFCLFYNFIISILTYFFYSNSSFVLFYRSSRIIRPFFLFYKSRDIKKLALS